ncbi:hypothetical protein [Nonomuraea rubra]|uniref:hypothetical protein n=1 Tax=Nonomuraea rubra TaxID=46180 RepID=UPI00361AF9F3
MLEIYSLLFFVAALGVPVMLACCATILAAMAAPRGRYGGVRGGYLFRGSSLAGMGLVGMVIAAWSTREDGHYDDFGSAMTSLAAIFSAAVFLLGLGPAVPWLLELLARGAARLPRPFRPAARHLADDRRRTAPAVATTMVATAITIMLAIIAHAGFAQSRANYAPEAQPGALVVRFSPEHAAEAEAAVRGELPGVPIVRGHLVGSTGYFDVLGEGATYIGDQALLRYLTGNPAMSYDAGTAVVVAVEAEQDHSVRIDYHLTSPDAGTIKNIPAITVEPVPDGLERVFVPMELVRGLGLQLDVEALIVDPALHSTSEADRHRLVGGLGERAEVHLEQGYQASGGWRYLAGFIALIALIGAWVATAPSSRPQVLRRIGSPRLLTACRAALAAACGAVPGAVAGCVVGLLLAWPFTTSIDWDPPPRVPFDTPWALIGLQTVAVPLLAAVAGLFVSGRVSGRGSRPPAP